MTMRKSLLASGSLGIASTVASITVAMGVHSCSSWDWKTTTVCRRIGPCLRGTSMRRPNRLIHELTLSQLSRCSSAKRERARPCCLDEPDRYAPASQVFFGLADGIVPVVENARGQCRARARVGQNGSQVLGVRPRPPRPQPERRPHRPRPGSSPGRSRSWSRRRPCW